MAVVQNNRNLAADELNTFDEEDEDTQANKYMTFHLNTESYGIGIKNIREIIEIQKITEVPDMPPYVKGVINLRGRVIPVVDLRLRFKLEARAYDDRTCIIVIEVKETSIGFIIDSVEEVLEITDQNIEPAPNFRSASGEEKYIMGLGKVNDAVKIILNVEKILFDDDIKLLHKNTESVH